MFLRCVLVLTILAPPPSEADAIAAYNRGDLDLALKLYRERAASPGVYLPDALYGVHDALRALYDRSERKDLARLCEAHELARGLVAGGKFASEAERAAWVEQEAADAKLLSEASATCPEPASATDDAPRGVTPELPAPVPKDSPARTEGSGSPTAPKDSPEPWRPRGRVVGGSVVAAAGGVMLGGMAIALAGRSNANDTIASITAAARTEDRDFTPDEEADAREADRRFGQLGGVAVVLGVAGFVSLVTGLAVILAPPRDASRARVRAQGAGFVYSF
ncbi:hypothetical protein [Nannocystis pusilla]|uniref:Uncharacterized protein n=1 Tax=Nannocystis pusilla TaxID=889268 RepID=A0ABS7TMG6_9BACT|nr:hypothetical protein [Nannocystis pusilla]MBZ5709418.1 hypothetical protein [Nannocystis pusilla]